MAFSTALYYPWIDIRDEAWLKTAILYWDTIHTIVPASIQQPYNMPTSKILNTEGLLLPINVSPDMREIEELASDVLEYLDSPEGAEVLFSDQISGVRNFHSGRMPMDVRRLVEIHPDKLPSEIRYRLKRELSLSDDSSWINVDSRFADFYMTLLATKLSERVGAGLLTNEAPNSKLATTVRLDAKIPMSGGRRREYDYGERWQRHHRDLPKSLAQALLADLILEKVNLDPDTPVKKIVQFRRQRADELGRFRTKIGELTKVVSSDLPPDAMRAQVKDIYVNEVLPAMNALKDTLRDSQIKWATDNLLKISFFSLGSTSVPFALLGLAVPQALLVGVGVSLTASAILYNVEKSDKLRQNPYSYLLAVQKQLA